MTEPVPQLHHHQDAIADSYGPRLNEVELEQLRDEACARVDEVMRPSVSCASGPESTHWLDRVRRLREARTLVRTEELL